ncbi:prolyl-tRNA synthetase associated domain-containing protein [Candidatus Dependentiae bacterium]|nr:prolyl-tRNA synthetase associated domain-containing protein [Candidatus Dependentiae bacterium]
MEEALYAYLTKLDIQLETHDHAPAFTCDQMGDIKKNLPAHGGIKNLFLKDKKKRYYLLCALYDTKIELKALAKSWDAPELRFARPDELETILGVKPGSVTLFALINDKDHLVQVILDNAMFAHERIGLHPLRNDKTTLITPQDAKKFAESLGYQIETLHN